MSLFPVTRAEQFSGGLHQTFVVRYLADTESQWTNLTKHFTDTSLKTIRGTSVSDLQPKTRSFVRVFAYNRHEHRDSVPNRFEL